MTGDQIQRVRSCGAGLAQDTIPFVSDCFERFFERCPCRRRTFPADLAGVHRAFARDLGFVVKNASTLAEHRDSLRAMGVWYRQRGVDGDEAVQLREAFLDALAAWAGAQWRDGLREDWGEVLDCWFVGAFGSARAPTMARAA